MEIKDLIGKEIECKDGYTRKIISITQEEKNLLEDRQQVTKLFNILKYKTYIKKADKMVWSDSTELVLNGSPLCQLFIKNLGL